MDRSSKRMYERWDIHQRLQHVLILVSFILVSVSGIPVKFAYYSWAQSFAKLFGSFEILFAFHKVGAVIMMIGAVYHLFWLIAQGVIGKLRWSMFPIVKDIKDFIHNFAYYCGLKKKPAQFKKYSYKEKMDYLAVYWGAPIMIFSGLALWFPGSTVGLVPKWVIDSLHYFHQDEGMLAMLFIFTIHFYNVHFSPDFFPMNYTWLTGKVSREVMEHEYPLELARIEEEERESGKQVSRQSSITH